MSSIEWQEARAPDGRLYWYNTISKQSVWEKPASLKTAAEKALDQTPWKQYTAAGGRQYYVHSETKETTWEMPADVAAALGAVPSLPPTPVVPPPSVGTQNLGGGTPNLGSSAPSFPSTSTASLSTSMGAGSGQLVGYTGATPFVSAAQPMTSEPVLWFNNDVEATKAFTDMLRQFGVNQHWTWERVLKETITQPMFKALKTSAERKAAFESLQEEMRLRDAERKQANLERIRPAWREGLGSASEQGMKSTWSWARAKAMLQAEFNEMWRMGKDDDERKTLWDEYVGEIRKKEVQREAEQRTFNLQRLAKLLEKFEIGLETNWTQTRRMIERSKEWQNDGELQQIDMSDFLQVYEERVKQQEKESDSIRMRQRDEKRRRIRKNRQAFVDLLEELRKDGKIKTQTDWATVYPALKSDERYQNMLGNPGSSPLELFWDVVDQLDYKVEENTRTIEVALAENRMNVKPESTWEEFVGEMLSHVDVAKRITDLEEEDRRNVFNAIQERHARLASEEKRRLEKKRRQAIDDLRYAIRKVEPEIGVESSYEDALPRISKLAEFDALKEEEDRKQAFDRYIQRMKERMAARKEEEDRQAAEEESRIRKQAEMDMRDKERRDRRRKREEQEDVSGSEASPRRSSKIARRSASAPRVPDGDTDMAETLSKSGRNQSPASTAAHTADDDREHRRSRRRGEAERDREDRGDRKRHRDDNDSYSRDRDRDRDRDRHRSSRSRYDDDAAYSSRRSSRRSDRDRDRDPRSSRRENDSPRPTDDRKAMDVDEVPHKVKSGKKEDGELEEGEVA